MSEETLSPVGRIRARLRRAIRRLALGEFLWLAAVTVCALLVAFLVATSVEAGLWLGRDTRSLLLLALVAILTIGLVVSLLVPSLRLAGHLPGLSEEGVARHIGSRFPAVSDRLVNLLQLASGRSSAGDPALLDRAVTSLGSELDAVEFERVEDFSRARRWGRFALAPAALLIVFLVAAPGTFIGATQRLLSPGTTYAKPAPFRLAVSPGDAELVRGATLPIAVRLTGTGFPDVLRLEWRNEDEERIEVDEFARDSSGAYTYEFVNVRRPLRYRIDAGAVQTDWYVVSVVERPLVRGLQLRLTFPSYTRLPERMLDPNVGNVAALAGTRVDVSVDVGRSPMENAELVFASGDTTSLQVSGSSARGSFQVRSPDTYQIRLANAEGVENQERIDYDVAVQPDAPPSVVLVEPEPVSDLTEALFARLRMRLVDDFGFSRLTLFYRLAESRFGEVSQSYSTVPIERFEVSLLDQEVIHPWELIDTGLDLVPGDEIAYYVEVRDNDTFAGYKAGRTPEYRLRFPSLAEQYERLAEEEDTAESELETLIRESEQMREQFENLRDEIRRKQDADWEDQRQLEQMSSQIQRLDERVQEVEQTMERISEQMEENDLVSPETLEAFQEMQRVLEEVRSPELEEALRKLQEALQNLDLSQMQQAFEQFEFNEEQYRQRLERALELFKRLRAEQMFDEAQRKAEELARRQQQMAEETRRLMEDAEPSEQGEPEDAKSPDGQEDEDPERQGDAEDGDEREQSDREDGDETEQSDPEDGDASERDPSEARQPDELAEEQDLSSQEMEDLEKLLEEIMEQLEELSNAPQDQLEGVQEDLERQDLPNQMQENSRQLLENELEDAQQGQQQMQQQLEQLAEQLQSMKQMMSQQQIEVNIAALRRVLDDVLTLSYEQESLREEVSPLSPDNPALRGMAQQQSELSDGLEVVGDTLQKLSENIPQMSRAVQRETGDALLSMNRAVSGMSEREVDRAVGDQKSSMTHLNNLALMLSDLMEQLMNMASGMGGAPSLQQLLEQLQQMSGEQQKINEQIQQMLNDMVGNRLTVDQQDRLSQVRSQQEALRRQLEEMSRNDELADQVLGDLRRIAEQMEETIEELERRQLGRPLVRRQQEILTRLLDAQRSLRERGRERRREGERPGDYARTRPPELQESDPISRLRRDLIRALDAGYAPDYEELIKRYFEALQNLRQTSDEQD